MPPTSPDKPAARRGGRQLAASEAQVVEVQQRREAGAILRTIASDTGLSMQTVRSALKKSPPNRG